MKNCFKACAFFFAISMINVSFAQSKETQQTEIQPNEGHLAASKNGVNAILTSRVIDNKTYLVLSLNNTNNEAVQVEWAISKGQEVYYGSAGNNIAPGQSIELFDMTSPIEIQSGDQMEDYNVNINLQ